MSIVFKDVTKTYDKGKDILQGLDLTIAADSIYCLLGKNGAGKSTLLNILTNLIGPTSGEVLLDDLSYSTDAMPIKKVTGVQCQFNQLIGELNARDFLMWTGLLYGMDKQQIATQTEHLTNFFFDEQDDLSGPAARYSAGMQRKLVLCSAVMHKPRYLVLDEHFANLDPIACGKLCEFLKAYRSPERVVVVSSHDLLYVDKIATHIGILDRGALVFNDTMARFKKDGLTIDQELLKHLAMPETDSSLINLLV